VWGAWAEVSVDLIEKVIKGLREFGLVVGNAIANWTKRQGAAVARHASGGEQGAVSAGAQRMRRYRKRKAEDSRQGRFAFATDETARPAAAPPHAPRNSVTPGVTSGADSETDYSASEDAESRDMPPTKGAQIIDFREGGHGRRSRRGRSELPADWQP